MNTLDPQPAARFAADAITRHDPLAETPSLGLARVAHVLFTVTLLRKGWEMDNVGWIVELEDGNSTALTTCHGFLCPWTKEEAQVQLAETRESLGQLEAALREWPQEQFRDRQSGDPLKPLHWQEQEGNES